jgi:hypothetical protein
VFGRSKDLDPINQFEFTSPEGHIITDFNTKGVDRSLRVEPNVVGGEKELRSPDCIWSPDAIMFTLVALLTPCTIIGTGSTNEACLFHNVTQYMWEAWYTDGTGTMRLGMWVFLAL